MAKFGALNTLQLTRELYLLKENQEKTKDLIVSLEHKIKVLEDKEESFFKKYLEHNKELIELGIEHGNLKEKLIRLEEKTSNYKLDQYFVSDNDSSKLELFLIKYNIQEFKQYLEKKGVRMIDDILFLTEDDLESDGLPIVKIRKLFQYTKQELELNTI